MILGSVATVTRNRLAARWSVFSCRRHTDPDFSANVRESSAYSFTGGDALVLAVGEKSQIQAPDHAAPRLPMLSTTP